jgi:hypothetical protein
MVRGSRLSRLVCLAGLVVCSGCGSGGGGKPAPMDAGGGGGDGPAADGPADVASGNDGSADSTGFEPLPLPYFYGSCRLDFGSTPVPTDRGPLQHGLTVLATGLPRTADLEVDAANFYLVTSSGILRLPVSAPGDTPVTMVAGAAPIEAAIDADDIYWVDAGVAGQTTIMRAPLTATGQAGTMLASQAGPPGPFTVAGGFVYFATGTVVSRVPTAGGAVQMVSTTVEPRGLAANADALFFTEFSDETIQRVSLAGTLPATPAFFKLAYAVPTAIVMNGGDLYFDDWFGGVEYLPIAAPTTGKRFSDGCGGPFAAACEYRLRPAARGAIWASEAGDCGDIGKVNPDGSEMMAGALAPLDGIAATSTHAYATTSLGELLRLDL